MNKSEIISCIKENKRIERDQAIELYQMPLTDLAEIADIAKRIVSDDRLYYNRNVHIEPTNVCVNHCAFCSYRARKGDSHAWEYTQDEMENLARKALSKEVTEIHIVGGVHPDWDINYYSEILKRIRKLSKNVHIKAFTAEEIFKMCDNANISIEQGVKQLVEAGLNSIPGGGAEIFNANIRSKICPDKIDANTWLMIHETVHNAGLMSNCTMLYGHMESVDDRIDHLLALRELQDKTNGFNAFIPLKYKSRNNKMSDLGEATIIDDMKTFAISRIVLDNIPHIKAYWPMLGKDNATMSLAFGVDDFDGTIDDSTKIYSLAGADEQKPSLNVEEITAIARTAGLRAVERDSLYNEI